MGKPDRVQKVAVVVGTVTDDIRYLKEMPKISVSILYKVVQ